MGIVRHMSYTYFDHDADIGITGKGSSIEVAFQEAAVAMFGIMQDLSLIHPKQSIDIEFTEEDIELAFVIWLNALIAAAREHGMVFCQFELTKTNAVWHGKAWGEPWPENLDRRVEVKGATLTMLSVKKLNDGKWDARCIVDV